MRRADELKDAKVNVALPVDCSRATLPPSA